MIKYYTFQVKVRAVFVKEKDENKALTQSIEKIRNCNEYNDIVTEVVEIKKVK
jgi:hypothetical protein